MLCVSCFSSLFIFIIFSAGWSFMLRSIPQTWLGVHTDHLGSPLSFVMLLFANKVNENCRSGSKGLNNSGVAVGTPCPAYPPRCCCHSLPEMHSVLVWVHAILPRLGTSSSLFLLQVLLDPLPLFHVLQLSRSIAAHHAQGHPRPGARLQQQPKQPRQMAPNTHLCLPSMVVHPWTAVKRLSWPEWLSGKQVKKVKRLAAVLN